MIHRDNVQSLEMDYYVTDVDLSYQEGKFLDHSTLLTTLFSRPRQGMLIVRNGLNVLSSDSGSSRITELTEAITKPFSDLRTRVLGNVVGQNP